MRLFEKLSPVTKCYSSIKQIVVVYSATIIVFDVLFDIKGLVKQNMALGARQRAK